MKGDAGTTTELPTEFLDDNIDTHVLLNPPVENEEKIRRITYSYRQYHRYKEAEQEQKEQETSRDVSQQNVEQQTSSKDENNEQYEGKKQGHREEDDA